MEHFIFFVSLFVSSSPSNLVFSFLPPQSASQSLLCLMYVTPVLGNTWMYAVSSFLSLSFLSFLPIPRHKQTHICTSLQRCVPESLGEIQILESVGYLLKLP